jgi:hypothetical protein
MTKPSIDAHTEMPLTPAAESPTPIPAIAAVSSLGMRRVRMSTTVAANMPAANGRERETRNCWQSPSRKRC